MNRNEQGNQINQLRYERREEAGLCIQCGKPVCQRRDGTKHRMCINHAEAERERSARRRRMR